MISPSTGLPVIFARSFKSVDYREKTMSKEQKSNKEDKKKPALSPKEKKAAKKSKKDSKS
jgi:hypothetical protein